MPVGWSRFQRRSKPSTLNQPIKIIKSECDVMSPMAKTLAALLLLMPLSSGAQAQTRLTTGELTKQLNQTAGNAQKVGIDVDAIRADIEARIKADGTENA